MKKLFIMIVLDLMLLCACQNKADGKDQDTGDKETDKTAVYRYFRYAGAENIKGGGKIMPDVFFDGSSYAYDVFLEKYRLVRYLQIDEEGKGSMVNIDYEEVKDKDINGNTFSYPRFYVREEEAVIFPDDHAARIGNDFYACFIQNGTLSLEYEQFEEVDEKVIKEIQDGTKDIKDLQDASIGDIVSIGRYEQDLCIDNGPDPLYWLVLDKKDDMLLLLSKDVIDDHTYDNTGEATTWETSSLRRFLNNEFFETVFSDEERNRIVESSIINRNYNDYLSTYWLSNDYIDYVSLNKVESGNDTKDRIFVLDIDEVNTYLGKEDDYYPSFMSADSGPENWLELWRKYGIDFSFAAGGRIAAPSQELVRYSNVGFSSYHQSFSRHYANYWLRTMADTQNSALAVTDIGAFVSFKTDAINVGVRPAMWVRVS